MLKLLNANKNMSFGSSKFPQKFLPTFQDCQMEVQIYCVLEVNFLTYWTENNDF